MDCSAFARLLAGGAAVLLLFVAHAPSVATQARERVAYVNALDRETRQPVRGLGVADFTIREDGIQREVLRVMPATSPMAIALLVDNTQAASGAVPDIRGAVTAFLKSVEGLGPVAIVGYADRPTILTDYTTNMKSLLAGVGRIFPTPGSGATLLDAIREAARGLAKREEDRAAIVVLATEHVEFSNLHYQQVLEPLLAAHAQLFVVVLTSTGADMTSEEARNRALLLDRGPRESGGQRWDVLASSAFEGQLLNVAAVLKSQYRVIYARPESLIPPERFEVSAVKAGVEAHGSPARGQAGRR